MDEKDIQEYLKQIDEISKELDYQQKSVTKAIAEKITSIQRTLEDLPPGALEGSGMPHGEVSEPKQEPREIIIEKAVVRYIIRENGSDQPDYFELS